MLISSLPRNIRSIHKYFKNLSKFTPLLTSNLVKTCFSEIGETYQNSVFQLSNEIVEHQVKSSRINRDIIKLLSIE